MKGVFSKHREVLRDTRKDLHFGILSYSKGKAPVSLPSAITEARRVVLYCWLPLAREAHVNLTRLRVRP